MNSFLPRIQMHAPGFPGPRSVPRRSGGDVGPGPMQRHTVTGGAKPVAAVQVGSRPPPIQYWPSKVSLRWQCCQLESIADSLQFTGITVDCQDKAMRRCQQNRRWQGIVSAPTGRPIPRRLSRRASESRCVRVPVGALTIIDSDALSESRLNRPSHAAGRLRRPVRVAREEATEGHDAGDAV
jgi:hypothetical protein